MNPDVFLGIETSCDETGCGIVDAESRVLAGIVASQIDEHKSFGGVVPEIASRAHAEKVMSVIDKALESAGLHPSDINAVAVTNGPGLIGPLLVGIAAAQGFAAALDIPLIPVNHLHAHLYSIAKEAGVEFPFTGLVASGGHTALYRWVDANEPKLLGTTVDDAVGEAFDKVAKLLGLEYPGGPAIEKAAVSGNPKAIQFPRPGISMEDMYFSFSGIKTAVLYYLQEKQGNLSADEKADIAASFQQAIAESIAKKCLRALELTRDRNFVMGGGVAANAAIIIAVDNACKTLGCKLHIPRKGMAGDNGVMVAHMGRYSYNNGMYVMPRSSGVTAFAKGMEREFKGRRKRNKLPLH